MKHVIKRVSLGLMLGLMFSGLSVASAKSLNKQIASEQQKRLQIIDEIVQSWADFENNQGPAGYMSWEQMQARQSASLANAQISQLQYLLQQEQALTAQIQAYKKQQEKQILRSRYAL